MTSLPRNPSFLEALPLDVFKRMTELLATDHAEPDRFGLFSLSLTSKTLCAATSWKLFETVRLVVVGRDAEKLVQDLVELERVLRNRYSTEYVRRLEIVEPWEGKRVPRRPWSAIDEEQREGTAQGTPTLRDVNFGRDLWAFATSANDFWPRERRHFTPKIHKAKFAANAFRQLMTNEATRHIFPGFLSQLTGLSDIIYDCRDTIPACLLSAMDAHPRSEGLRLQVNDFSFYTLRGPYQNVIDDPDVESSEYALATSSHLHAVSAIADYNCASTANYSLRASLCMAAGLAPRLKSFSLEEMATSPPEGIPAALRRPPGQGLLEKIDSTPQGANGCLETLTLDATLSRASMNNWVQRVDFSALHALHLRSGRIYPCALQVLVEHAKSQGFKSLRTLTANLLTVEPVLGNYRVTQNDALSELLGFVPPLETLHLVGELSEDTFEAALNYHGASLRQLRVIPSIDMHPEYLPFVLSVDLIEELCLKCPNLEALELTIPRTKGDKNEARIYRALSGLRLDSLSLLLDCSNLYAMLEVMQSDGRDAHSHPALENVPGWSTSTNCFPRHMRDSWINGAVDITLATSVFETLSSAKAPRAIRLQTRGVCNLGQGWSTEDHELIRRLLGGGWVRVQDPRQGHEEEFYIGALEAENSTVAYDSVGQEDLCPEFQLTWDSIWPGEVSDKGKKTWKSFPLWKEHEMQ